MFIHVVTGNMMIIKQNWQRKPRTANGGEAGIRTLGGLPLNGFQDRRFRPLSHLSATASGYYIRNSPL